LNSKLVSIIFSQNGLNLQTAANGAEAVEKIRTQHFDIILMDIEMPVLDGYRASALIRHELENNVPIIAMTAHNRPGEREKCLQLGMNDYIIKPFDEIELFSKIHNLTCRGAFAGKSSAIIKTEAAPSSQKKVCVLDYLENVTRGNKKMMAGIIQVFMEETPAELTALDLAILSSNYTVIRDIAHKLKSSFLLLGISELEPVFTEMEDPLRTATGIERITYLRNRVNSLFNRAREEMLPL
jgi:CheY-like chemotaxis protein